MQANTPFPQSGHRASCRCAPVTTDWAAKAVPQGTLLSALERLEPRMLLSGDSGEDHGLVGPLAVGVAEEWVPFVPSAEQTEISFNTIGDRTSAKVSVHFGYPAYRVTDWGLVKREGNRFYVDAKVEQSTLPHIDLYIPTTLSQEYELGKLDPNAKYAFVFSSWGKVVQTVHFSVPAALPIVSVSTPTPQIREPIPWSEMPILLGNVTISRAEPSAQALGVHLKLGGTATLGKDYQIDPAIDPAASDAVLAWIPAGEVSTTIWIMPLEDTAVEGDETVELTLIPADTYGIGEPPAATITIVDTTPSSLPVVTIDATDPIATEPDTDASLPLDRGRLTVTRSGPTDQGLMVTLMAGGTATGGPDYELRPEHPVYTFAPLPPGQVLIYFPEGQSISCVDVIPHGDAIVEDDETVIVTVVDGWAYDAGEPRDAIVTIRDSSGGEWVPYVPAESQVELSVHTLADGTSRAAVTLHFSSPGFEVRDWGTVQQSGVELSVDTRIERTTGPVPLYVPPPMTHVYELGTLDPGEYSFSFLAWGKLVKSLPFKVRLPEIPTITIVAANPVATEPVAGGPQPRMGQFQVVQAGPGAGDVTVRLAVGGTAAHGGDYLFGAFEMGPFLDEVSVTIPQGYSWVPIPVLAKADFEVEPPETVVLTILPGGAYTVGIPAAATVKILDTCAPILRICDPADPDSNSEVPVQLPGAGDQLDLAGNELIVRLSDSTELAGMLDYLEGLVRSAHSGGTWDGAGITSSVAARDEMTGLAVIASEEDNTIIVSSTCNGDVNLDGIIDGDDYQAIDEGFLMSKSPRYEHGDFNYDLAINGDDYFLIDSAHLGQARALAPADRARNAETCPAKIIAAAKPTTTAISVAASGRTAHAPQSDLGSAAWSSIRIGGQPREPAFLMDSTRHEDPLSQRTSHVLDARRGRIVI